MKKIKLISASPRRINLLKLMGYTFDTDTVHVNENYPENIPVFQVPLYLAHKKLDKYLENKPLLSDCILITADTVVILDNKILGKPEDEKDAYNILKSLSGRWHEVITAVVIYEEGERIAMEERSRVKFGELSDVEIKNYIHHFKPFDKAGSYGIQEWIGLIGIEEIQGSFHNIMGFPVYKVYQALKRKGIIPDFMRVQA